ncbi:CyaY protein [Chitinivorax tropicus]|uniref:Iron-sulfur cluster assembly protein CyaY n=1 Tax=Chitinivorax tropicus TaxID=714531 RepID=A0A840MQ81_9PROT|nr:iron donor protein CyaY [Chitinivorax tropicus]MBB5018333.1 CyaY protein [Chitinivorax tropicus]
MDESDFLDAAEAVFNRIETAIDASGLDIECNLNESVMELEFDDGTKIIVNRHTPNRELWIAARSGGFHYAWRDDAWRNTRDGSEFFASLARLVSDQAGDVFQF